MSSKSAGKHGDSLVTPTDTDDTTHPAGPQNNDDKRHNEEMFNLLSQLKLPRMSINEHPSLRILVIADIDLKSAAALAEHALQNQQLGGGNIDCIIACGPFARDEDIRQYLQGRYCRIQRKPHERSRQETAALEGIMSSTLSQLESIVCRVIYVPHPTDPLTTQCPSKEYSREHICLTSNSVNIHEQWLPLAPGIGCCGFGGITSRQQERLYGPYRTCVRHGREYQEALTRILALAPPSSTSSLKRNDKPSLSCQEDIIFSCQRRQSILVTQVGTANNTTTTTTTHPDRALDVFEWPRDHSSFIESYASGLVLNIAAAPCPPFQQVVGNETFLVSPGSLRECGDYCLIDIGIHQEDCNNAKSSHTPFTWKVDRMQFHNMNSSTTRNE